MPNVSLTDYLTLLDGTQRIQSGSLDLSFNLPDDFVAGTNLAKPVVSFRFQAHAETQIQVFANRPLHPAFLDITFGATNFVRMYHEFVSGNQFRAGENTIDFALAGDNDGDISIGGVLLTFQRRIEV